jgi:hypothetical protein
MESSILQMLWRIPVVGMQCINYYYQYDYWYHGLSTGSVQDSGEAIADCVADLQGQYNYPKGSQVVTRYTLWLQLSIIHFGRWFDDQIGSLWGEQNLCLLNSISSKLWQWANTDMYTYDHGWRVVWAIVWRWLESVAGIQRIHMATAGWTVWALSAVQLIGNVCRQRKDVELMYWIPTSERTGTSLSDSPSWAWLVHDLPHDLIRTNGGSHGGFTVNIRTYVDL